MFWGWLLLVLAVLTKRTEPDAADAERKAAKARRVEQASVLPESLRGLLKACADLPPVKPSQQGKAVKKKPSGAQKKPAKEQAQEVPPKQNLEEAGEEEGEEEHPEEDLEEEEEVEEEEEEEEEEESSGVSKKPAGKPDTLPSVPSDLPREAGVRPAGQKSWAVYGPNGGKIEVLLVQRVFYVKHGPVGQRSFAWIKCGGVPEAWEQAKAVANF